MTVLTMQVSTITFYQFNILANFFKKISDLSVHTHPVCDVCVHALWLTLHSHEASRQRLMEGVSEAWC